MSGYPAEVDGYRFLVPPHMIGVVDRASSWGVGIEQQEMGFLRQVVDAFGTTERVDDILVDAATREAQKRNA